MSSPYSNLNKSRKAPLPSYNVGQRSVPFRQTMDIMDIVRSPKNSVSEDIDEERLLSEVSSQIATSRTRQRDPYGAGLPRLNDNKPGSRASGPVNASALAGPNDMDLMSSMMSRISQLELRIQFQGKEIVDKDRKINILEDKMKILNKSRAEGDQAKIQELEKQNHKLQRQIQEMEAFLTDYGMIWLGDSDSSDSEGDEEADAGGRQDTHRTWSQAASVPEEFKVDYNLVVENIKELNILAGEGIGQVKQTADGARLKMPDPVNFTLYANGILLFNGPFRPFSDPETKQCIRDIMDGYFPSELQGRYPDGVPFLVNDKRNVNFRDKRSDVFKGSGQTLGGDTKPSRLVPSNLEPSPKPATVSSRTVEETSQLPGPQLTVDQFLRKLPASVIREGKIIDIRGSLSDTLKGDMQNRKNTVMVVETETVKDLKSRLEVEDESRRPPSSRNVATLRIKTDDQTYILKMRFHETVGDIRKYLDQKRKSATSSYELMSSFPKKVFDNDHMTLEEAGLIPNATLHLKHKK